MNKQPFAEPCKSNEPFLEISLLIVLLSTIAEEVRVELLELMDTCMDSDKTQFVPQLGAISTMLSRVAGDTNPEMKQKVASFAGTLCRELKDQAGHHMKNVVIGLTANLAH